MLLETLGETCKRTGWRIHAYVLMGNHYHLLLETMEPNLVVGMHWLQGTYTARFNSRHREYGHLFQGRYKAALVEPTKMYFPAVATYIHLNPVRVQGYDFVHQRLRDFEWSSYPAYVERTSRPDWLCVERVLGDLGLEDTVTGRRRYAAFMQKKVLEVQHADQPWRADKAWEAMRRGWCWGGEEFRHQMTRGIEEALKKGKRSSFDGDGIKEHDAACAEAWIAKGMERLGLDESDLKMLKMNGPEKYALAWLVRRHSSVSLGWIRSRLRMGSATSFAYMLNKLESSSKGEWGYAEYTKVKGLLEH